MRRVALTIKKRPTFNIHQALEVGKNFRVIVRAGLYHWDLITKDYSSYHQGTTRCLHHGHVISYAGQEEGKPLFTFEGYTGIFRPLNCGAVPQGYLEPVNDEKAL